MLKATCSWLTGTRLATLDDLFALALFLVIVIGSTNMVLPGLTGNGAPSLLSVTNWRL